jgi:hypothetical protein
VGSIFAGPGEDPGLAIYGAGIAGLILICVDMEFVGQGDDHRLGLDP